MSESPPNQTIEPSGALETADAFSYLRHELRTPLNQILGYTEMLQEDAEAAGQQGFLPDLKRIHRAAHDLLDTINTQLGKPPAKPDVSQFQGSLPESIEGETTFITKIREAKTEDRKITGSLLVADDNEANRDVLSRRLEKEGFTVSTANDGRDVLRHLRDESFDLVLLDVMMPELDGYTTLQIIKADPRIRHIPIIMISALDELEAVIRCIEAGAEDFLPKPFNPTLLRARIGACLEKKQLRDQEQKTHQALVESQKHLAAELAEAAEYVKSLLPPPAPSGPVRTEWRFVPSTELGGDAFGYHWIDPDHFAIYLLDVCGHGVGAALLSISVINVLRSHTLAQTDFHDPSQVLGALNDAFPMEEQNNMYFTMWYGVFNRPRRELVYASGGHPPAVLVPPGGGPRMLGTPGIVIGSLSGMKFPMARCAVPAGARLFVFSDGAYELDKVGGGMLQLDEFCQFLARASGPDEIVTFAQSVQGKTDFVDDFSLVQIIF